MKKILYLSTVLIVISTVVFGQEFENFSWKTSRVEISAVEMKFTDANKKVVFNGYKDSFIKFYCPGCDGPLATKVSVKLGGYFEIVDGDVTAFSIVSTDEDDQIQYTVYDGASKMASIIMIISKGEKKPYSLVVVCASSFTGKNIKALSFVLKTFEVFEL